MPGPINVDAAHIDLSSRVFSSTTVAGFPGAAVETIVASFTLGGDLALMAGIYLWGFATFTVGTSGTAATLRIRRTDTSGAIQANSGALTVAATNVVSPVVMGFDTQKTLLTQVYVLTLTVTAAVASSTVTACEIRALAV